jgi:uncharacterized protein YlxW (UPF0749 family)
VNQFMTTIRNNSWVWPVTFMMAVTGLLLGGALRSRQKLAAEGVPGGRPLEVAVQIKIQQDTIKKLNEEIGKLREKQFELQDVMTGSSKQSKVLKDTLDELQVKSGLTPVYGQGIEVILSDSKQKQNDAFLAQNYLIHDFDVLRIVNELFASGAEAISVNGHRLIGGYSIRCVGPVIHVNNSPIGSPVIIEAIGDPTTLRSAMEMSGGVLGRILETDTEMVRLTNKVELHLKGYEGFTQTKFAKKEKDVTPR